MEHRDPTPDFQFTFKCPVPSTPQLAPPSMSATAETVPLDSPGGFAPSLPSPSSWPSANARTFPNEPTEECGTSLENFRFTFRFPCPSSNPPILQEASLSLSATAETVPFDSSNYHSLSLAAASSGPSTNARIFPNEIMHKIFSEFNEAMDRTTLMKCTFVNCQFKDVSRVYLFSSVSDFSFERLLGLSRFKDYPLHIGAYIRNLTISLREESYPFSWVNSTESLNEVLTLLSPTLRSLKIQGGEASFNTLQRAPSHCASAYLTAIFGNGLHCMLKNGALERLSLSNMIFEDSQWLESICVGRSENNQNHGLTLELVDVVILNPFGILDEVNLLPSQPGCSITKLVVDMENSDLYPFVFRWMSAKGSVVNLVDLKTLHLKRFTSVEEPVVLLEKKAPIGSLETLILELDTCSGLAFKIKNPFQYIKVLVFKPMNSQWQTRWRVPPLSIARILEGIPYQTQLEEIYISHRMHVAAGIPIFPPGDEEIWSKIDDTLSSFYHLRKIVYSCYFLSSKVHVKARCELEYNLSLKISSLFPRFRAVFVDFHYV
ncbi:hypothetical protein BDQ17DRAFT_1359938 [Cyathus striatus]|nr:hypothetical protein BDQ17DRAFT_1359938 [Cyathus striatus]